MVILRGSQDNEVQDIYIYIQYIIYYRAAIVKERRKRDGEIGKGASSTNYLWLVWYVYYNSGMRELSRYLTATLATRNTKYSIYLYVYINLFIFIFIHICNIFNSQFYNGLRDIQGKVPCLGPSRFFLNEMKINIFSLMHIVLFLKVTY